jgi:predicted DNA-binding transcriptional regulator YafY
VSHDTDKLIRQLSLVAFLMAERRALTARDIKSTVEGYSEMSDEAFARRFYSDRSELLALGVPLNSQRDEFTGEELYTMRSEQYFLPELRLNDDELAALQLALHLLEGHFAYAEPLRLALQNLALGRAVEAPVDNSVLVADPDYTPRDIPGRITKLENAISKGRTVKFTYWSIGSDEKSERTVNPYALYSDNGAWYLVGLDLDRSAERTFRLSRMRDEIRFATRRERDFRPPENFDVSRYRGRPPWQVGETVDEARVELSEDTAWWTARALGDRGELAGTTFTTPYASLDHLASWVLRQEGRARPLAPPQLVEDVARSAERVAEAHERAPSVPASEAPPDEPRAPVERPVGPVAPERFAVLQALLAHLLAACGDQPRTRLDAEQLARDFGLTLTQLDEHLQLLNLVNFGGGCYAVYAALDDGEVAVEKELWGDAFRRPPRLTPLEARAIRLALEFVGPLVAAEAHTPLQNVRRKLEETFGQFDREEERESREEEIDEELIGDLSRAQSENRLVEIEYVSVNGETSVRTIEPHWLERELPHWYVHSWDRTRDAKRSFRLDRMKRARVLDERFERRSDLGHAKLEDTRSARVLFSPAVARWRSERGAVPLEDGGALEDMRVGSADWLVGEILFFRGEAEVLEPADLRELVGKRARALATSLRKKRKTTTTAR